MCRREKTSITTFFESIKIENTEYAQQVESAKRLLPLNYDTTMRFVTHLRLPLRTGENIAKAGNVYSSALNPQIEQTWKGNQRAIQI